MNHRGRPSLRIPRNSYSDYSPNRLAGCHILETSVTVTMFAVSAEALFHASDYYHRFDFERTR